MYEDLWDAKTAVDHLSGFNIQNRYITVLYHRQDKLTKRLDLERREAELREMQAKHGIDRNAL